MNQIIIFCATYLIFISALYAGLHVILKHNRKHLIQHFIIIFGSAVLAWVVAHVLKEEVAHLRPDLTQALIVPDDKYSFPSGHATFMFALAFAMYGFDKRAGIFIGTLAVVTGISRVLAGVHFWYDILGGFILGAGIAYIITLVASRIFKK